MKDKKYIISAIVMVALGVAVCFAGSASLAAAAGAEQARIQALVGDKTIVTGEGTAAGFAGEIKAVVQYADDIIVSVELSGDAETPDIGGAAMAELKSAIEAANTLEGIDAVSGATYTSNGVFSAVKAAMGIVEYVPTDEELFDAYVAENFSNYAAVDCIFSENILGVYGDGNGSYVMLAQGVGHYPDHPFKVAVALDANGAVTKIGVIYSHETDGFGTEVLKEAYWQQYFGAKAITRKSGVADATKIDTVSGATETSVGLYNIVKATFAQFAAM